MLQRRLLQSVSEDAGLQPETGDCCFAATTTTILVASLAAGGSVTGSVLQKKSASKAAKLSTDSANRSADIQAAADKEAMAFAQKTEDTRKAEHDRVEALNLDQYNQREGRLAPYRDLGVRGVSTLDTLMRPGPGTAFLPPRARTGDSLVEGM